MMRGVTLLIWGGGVSKVSVIFDFVYKILKARYRLHFKPNHFKTLHKSFYAPTIKWPGHIVLPLSVIPSFRHSGFSFRSLSKSYMEIFKLNLVHGFVTRIRRLSSNLGLVK